MGSRKHKIPKNKNTTKRFRRTRSKKQRGSGAQCSRPGYIEEEDPNTIDEYLALAIEEETPRCVKKYLNKGANPNILILDEHLHLPEDVRSEPELVPVSIYAARHIQPSTILQYLVEKGAFLEPDLGTTLLIEAAEYGNLSAASYLLSIDVDINATTGSGVPAIAYAVRNEDIPMIRLMLDERKGKINFNYTVFGRDNENVIDEAQENSANTDVAKILKKYVIEQNITPKQVRQQDRVNLGRVVHGVRGTSNRGPGGKLPLDITRMMEGDTSHINQWSTTNSYLGGKRKNKTRKRRTKRTTRRGVQKGRDEVIS